jgi:hypothetical protein
MRLPGIRRRLAARPRFVVGLCLGALASVGAWAGPARAEEPTLDETKYNPTELPPDGAGGRLMLAGALLTVGWYGASVGTSYLYADAPNAKDLRIPVVGPWMALADVGCGDNESRCSNGSVILRTALAVIGGVGQLGGLLAFTEGVFVSTRSDAPANQTPNAAAKKEAVLRSDRASWIALPVALPDGIGVEWIGHF